MAKAVADVNGEDQGGFASDNSNITGFSHMHDSGTGGSPSLGNFPIFPYAGCRDDDVNNCAFPQTTRAVPRVNGSIVATPGYFALNMSSGIRAEMTVSNHTALYRFTFPAVPDASNASLSPMILADLTDLPLSRSYGQIAVDDKTGRITGSGTFSPSFGVGTYNLSFCADFRGSSLRDSGVFDNNRAGVMPKSRVVYDDGVDNSPEILPAGAWVRFEKPETDNQMLVRVGVSFIGPGQACKNAAEEVPHYDFNGLKAAAEKAWRDKLSVIDVVPGSSDISLQTVFWSGVYRSMISPQDYTGENYLWRSSEPYYDSYYCIWDSFRTIHPFITIVDPESQSRMMRSLVDIYRHEGKLPDCRMSLCKGFTQGGSNADVLLADAYLKKVADVDWATAYEAVVSDAEQEPANWDVEGRGGLTSWKQLHYVPTDDFDPLGTGTHTRSISRTVEYAYDDFCVAELAHALGGREADAAKYRERAGSWRNMWNEAQRSSINGTDTGFTGFLQPRYLNGTFGEQDPILCSPLLNFTSCYLNPDGHETYEGSAWLYSFFAPGDMAAVVALMGGPAAFVRRLDYFHDSGLNYVGDEQGFLPLYLYHYAGRPGLSARRIRTVIPAQFNATVAGIPGNDDSGAMGSFAALAMMGLFPNGGQDVYLITPPFFEEVAVTNGQTGRTARVRNVGFDASGEAVYVQSATLDGKPYARSWIGHSFFLEGGTLELTLGRNETEWGTRDEDLPPSLSTSAQHY